MTGYKNKSGKRCKLRKEVELAVYVKVKVGGGWIFHELDYRLR